MPKKYTPIRIRYCGRIRISSSENDFSLSKSLSLSLSSRIIRMIFITENRDNDYCQAITIRTPGDGCPRMEKLLLRFTRAVSGA